MNSRKDLSVHFYKVRDEMKKASDRILRRSVLSVLVAAVLYTPQVIAFTKTVNSDETAEDELVENGTQNVYGKTSNITVGMGGWQIVESGGIANDTIIGKGGLQSVNFEGITDSTTIGEGGTQTVGGTATSTTIKQGGTLEVLGGDRHRC